MATLFLDYKLSVSNLGKDYYRFEKKKLFTMEKHFKSSKSWLYIMFYATEVTQG